MVGTGKDAHSTRWIYKIDRQDGYTRWIYKMDNSIFGSFLAKYSVNFAKTCPGFITNGAIGS